MKFSQNFLFILISTVFLTSSIFAQSEDWKTVSPIQEEFSVLMPQNSNLKPQVDPNDIEQNGSYSSIAIDTYLLIQSSKEKKWDLNKIVQKYAKSNNAKKTNFQNENIKGYKYAFKDKDGFYNKVVKVSTKNKNYIFHTASILENDSSVNRFFKSIEFKFGQTKKRLENMSAEVTNTDKNNECCENDSGKGSGVGVGGAVSNDFGYGSNSKKLKKKSNSSESNKIKGPTLGIKILATPRPGYTEIARQYNIDGIVKVKVAFLSDGTIGAVTPITRIPFGLTSNAIKASKKLKFSPPMRNGVKYSVSKIVAYNFNIY